MKPTRPAPSVEEAKLKARLSNRSNNQLDKAVQKKKVPPPRPPPPKFSTHTKANDDNLLLMDFSPPSSPIPKGNAFGGSCSSSGSFSTCSLSSKSSIDSDVLPATSVSVGFPQLPSVYQHIPSASSNTVYQQNPSASGHSNGKPYGVPTIIRAQAKPITKITAETIANNKQDDYDSPPMPTTTAPSLPPHGIALYDYMGTHIDDLTLQANDIVFLIRNIGDDWFYGKVDDREGMFPANYVSVKIPLPPETGNVTDNVATVTFAFSPETRYDLPMRPGQRVTVLHRISEDWLYGECNGIRGQFPVNFIDKVPTSI